MSRQLQLQRTPRLRPRPEDQNGHPATRHLPAHISQEDGLPFYLEKDGLFVTEPKAQSSLIHDVSPAEYYPERSLQYLNPVRTTFFRNYELFDDEQRKLKEASFSPGPPPAESFKIPSGGRFLLAMDSEALQVPFPGPGSYNPNKSEAVVIPNKSPCAAGWRHSPAPTPTEVAMSKGAETAGPGTFLGLAKPSRINSVSWGSGVADRFDQQGYVDQTGPLLGPGTYTDVIGSNGFGRGGNSAIIRGEHNTAALIRRMKAASKNGMISKNVKKSDSSRIPLQKRQEEKERVALLDAIRSVGEQIVSTTSRELELDKIIEEKKIEFLRTERIRRRKQVMRRAMRKGFGFSNVVQEAFRERKRVERIQRRYREMLSRRKTVQAEITELLKKQDRLKRALSKISIHS